MKDSQISIYFLPMREIKRSSRQRIELRVLMERDS